MQDLHFALDIGTRGVTGLLYSLENEVCRIHFSETEEHQDRSMQDGQIHDIQAVAKVITHVKERLAEISQQVLTKVAVAAAGRALKTIDADASFPLNGNTCSTDDVVNLQLIAVQNAKSALTGDHAANGSPFALHCVGYSVHSYYLDDEKIGNLVGQRGQQAKVALIATFLPRVVIDSLDSALKSAGLLMHGLTLEPIAALNALIPKTMRKLNIALVDIGAGTSDIAITADGTVQAYGMVPIAGDEITEALVNLCLLDFPVAESLKRQLLLSPKQSYEDILGVKRSIASKKLLTQLKPSIENLAQSIADEILRLNNKPPTAVMLIGGGAKTAYIESLLAAKLGLSNDRVRVRDRESIANVNGCENQLSGPEAVTPIGISLTASTSEITPISVTVDGKSTRLFAFHPLTVGDALLEAGVDLAVLKTRPGAAIVVEVNGEVTAVTGTLGSQGKLLKNGQPSTLIEVLEAGDELFVIPAVQGQNATGTLNDVVQFQETIPVWIDDQLHSIKPIVFVNGRIATSTTKIKDRDQIISKYPTVFETVETQTKITLDEICVCFVNGNSIEIKRKKYQLAKKPNSTIWISKDSAIEDGMRIYLIDQPKLKVKDVLDAAAIPYSDSGTFTLVINGTNDIIRSLAPILKNGHQTDQFDPIEDGDSLEYRPTDIQSEGPFTISDVIYRLGESLRLQTNTKERLVIKINGQAADFSSVLQHLDQVEVYWEERQLQG